ncbi:MAG: rhodanese-like domain-containing protein [bacterium]|nr:rhodanese-like domain-containing protein [bacterium]
MKLRSMLLISVLTMFLFTGCNTSTPAQEASNEIRQAARYQTITASKAQEIISAQNDVVILDVRTEEEYQTSHIANAILLPYDEISKKAEATLTNKDATILVYCRSGNRSAIAAKELASLGYTNILDFGGINDWPYEVTTN